MCKERVTAFAGKIRLAHIESPLRLSNGAYMLALTVKLLISVVPEVGVEPIRF